jgi:hypothetical protein
MTYLGRWRFQVALSNFNEVSMFSDLLSDGNGERSSIRFIMLGFFIWFILDWIYGLYSTGSYNPTYEKILLLCSVFGFKVIQKFKEL